MFGINKEKFYGTNVLQKYIAHFVTVDGQQHVGLDDGNWINQDAITCSSPEFLTLYAKRDGYLQDENFVIYPMANILSIKWELINEIKVIADRHIKEFKIFYTKDEICKANIVREVNV